VTPLAAEQSGEILMGKLKYGFLLGLIGVVLASVPAYAPNSRGGRDRAITGTITPERVNSDAEEEAGKLQESLPRHRKFYFVFTRDAKEFAGLAKYVVFLFSVWTQKPEELPVKRIFIRAARGEEIPALRVSSWRTPVNQGSAPYKRWGGYRQDGFYLVPSGALMRDGQLIMDLTNGATEWVMMELPSIRASVQDPKERVLSGDPAPGDKPNVKVLQDFIRHEFPGFPVPDFVQ
jgi:hypothetical protein